MEAKNCASRMAIMLLLIFLLTMLCACTSKEQTYQKNQELAAFEQCRLVIAGNLKDFKSMELVTQRFNELYPNCKVEYEYIQDYANTLPKRINSNDDRVDLFLTANIQEGSANMEYALNLLEYTDRLDLSDTFSGLTDNFKYVKGEGDVRLYAVPLGGEMRGLYVNETLLSSLGIAIPTNRSELLSAAEKLSAAGYVAFQDNPASFGQRIIFPYIAHMISRGENADLEKLKIINGESDAAEFFREPLEFIYYLVENNYYNYKYVETEKKNFLDTSDEGIARSFLNIVGEDGVYEKADDFGQVPFMTSADSLLPTIDRVKEDYGSTIEYRFILAPVSENGGYAYMSPTIGLAVNKGTYHKEWALEFMNYLFSEETNKASAELFNVTPNTSDALEIISNKYGIPVEAIGQPQDVALEGYNLFNMINPTIIAIAKANNPKYMKDSTEMYSFEYYMEKLRNTFDN